MISFSKILTVTSCASEDRLIDSYATVINILSNTRNNKIILNLNFTPKEERIKTKLKTLLSIAGHTSNILNILDYPESCSLAYMYYRVATDNLYKDRNYWLSVDDDVIIPAVTLQTLGDISKEITSLRAYLYGFFEIENKRNYLDWVSKPVKNTEEVVEHVKEFGEKSSIHRLYDDTFGIRFVEMKAGQHSGSFMVPIKSIVENQELLDKLKVWPKGLRGVDVEICKAQKEIIFLQGANAYHTDATGAHIENVLWTKDVENKSWGS